MLIKLTGGRIYDPANGIDGEVRDIFIENGRIVDPSPDAKVAHEYPVHGRVIMAGGIDPHSHIGGGKMTIARMMLPEDHIGQEVERTDITRAGVGHAIPSTMTAGYRYAEMGYTAAFEPAMLPANARQAHMELADTAIIDKGGDMVLVLEARHRVVRLVFEEGARDAPGLLRLEQRQPAAVDKVMDEGRNEHRLAGARQPGDAEAQRRGKQPGGSSGQRVEGNARLVGESSQR